MLDALSDAKDFFQRFTRERLRDGESFVAVLEVCGFNDWLIRILHTIAKPTTGGSRPAVATEERTISRWATSPKRNDRTRSLTSPINRNEKETRRAKIQRPLVDPSCSRATRTAAIIIAISARFEVLAGTHSAHTNLGSRH